jgi:cytochrome c
LIGLRSYVSILKAALVGPLLPPRQNSRRVDNTEVSAMRSLLLATILITAGLGGAQAQDAAAGQKVFAICKTCHQVGDTAKNAVGPVLNGLFGRKSGSVDGFSYSSANKNSGITWDEATFAEYIKDPKAKVPGTKMSYAGLKDEQKIKDLIAFLHQYDKAPLKLAQ